jgi:hypothetical protein
MSMNIAATLRVGRWSRRISASLPTSTLRSRVCSPGIFTIDVARTLSGDYPLVPMAFGSPWPSITSLSSPAEALPVPFHQLKFTRWDGLLLRSTLMMLI